MEALRDLKLLAQEVVQNFNEKFDAKDRIIPQTFKNKVRGLKSFSIVYNEYSVVIKGDGVRSKDSYVPNQSFFMASFFIEYSYELSKYKQKVLSVLSTAGLSNNELTEFFTLERDKGKDNVVKGEDRFVQLLEAVGYNEDDKEYLVKFVTDYSWWSGSKTIDRSDFFNSPVLSIMGLTASSNAAMALIVDYLTQNPDDSKLLLEQIETKEQTNMVTGNQIIYYGAPGTGKSHKIKDDASVKAADEKNLVFRTTFHPDSDYSTFVGCYKPTKVKSFKQPRMDMSLDDLAKALGSYYKNEELGKIGGLQQFCLEYYPYIDGEYMSVNVTKLIELAGVPKDYNVEVNKYIKFIHLLPHHDPDKIAYEFIPQAFTNAYVKAWNTKEDVYLIIEEINRGNCAQIFGDLFQLLDRKNGVSEYPIDADADLANYLSKKLAGSTHKDITDEIREGKKLKLPSNLYIWATMNTSDQSLFPIDSAFKRRWDWTYMKIKNHPEENYKIKLSDTEYDWWEFIQRINEIIASMTSSADKQLGYFFCKAAGDGTISPETFVSKVIFYLWNDVFKDYGFEDASLFRYKNDKDEMKDLTFPDFYDEAGEKVNETRLKDFLDKVLNWKKDDNKNND